MLGGKWRSLQIDKTFVDFVLVCPGFGLSKAEIFFAYFAEAFEPGLFLRNEG